MNTMNTLNTYLGQKGYTLSKSQLTDDQQTKIRNDLTVKPFVMGSISSDAKVFPVYRESPNKIYVPHYYGVATFGPPKQYKVAEGNDIDVNFIGTLRDYQDPVVHKFIDHCKSPVSYTHLRAHETLS
jgi:hypothetical protein